MSLFLEILMYLGEKCLGEKDMNPFEDLFYNTLVIRIFETNQINPGNY